MATETEDKQQPEGKGGGKRPIPVRLREMRATLYRILAELAEQERGLVTGPHTGSYTVADDRQRAEELLVQAADFMGQAEMGLRE